MPREVCAIGTLGCLADACVESAARNIPQIGGKRAVLFAGSGVEERGIRLGASGRVSTGQSRERSIPRVTLSLLAFLAEHFRQLAPVMLISYTHKA